MFHLFRSLTMSNVKFNYYFVFGEIKRAFGYFILPQGQRENRKDEAEELRLELEHTATLDDVTLRACVIGPAEMALHNTTIFALRGGNGCGETERWSESNPNRTWLIGLIQIGILLWGLSKQDIYWAYLGLGLLGYPNTARIIGLIQIYRYLSKYHL